uniref:Uncharacterized protein n=1 Tax=Chenopodium quinoa TaxID=63459 RepID=A0A803M1Q6_CHEQI
MVIDIIIPPLVDPSAKKPEPSAAELAFSQHSGEEALLSQTSQPASFPQQGRGISATDSARGGAPPARGGLKIKGKGGKKSSVGSGGRHNQSQQSAPQAQPSAQHSHSGQQGWIKLGLRRFLFLDKLYEESDRVRFGYSIQLQRSVKILCMFVVPCFIADTAYKIWWYATGGPKIPHFGNLILSHTIACFLEQCSWLYRTSIFFLACVLYRVSCYLQILRFEDFAQVFQLETDVAMVLLEHLRIRKTLRIISHRFRTFILFTLLLVTASQFASLLVITKSDGGKVDLYTAGEVALCSVTLVTGVCICLRSAAKITHKAQAITSLAAKWHICATIDSFDAVEGQTTPITRSFSPLTFPYCTHTESDEEEGDGDDDLDNTKMVPVFANTISYQKRQALVTYLENNRAGITVYGFMLDRSYLHTIFGVELSLVLWLLSKTVGIS